MDLNLEMDLDGKWNGLGLDISLGLEMIGSLDLFHICLDIKMEWN